MKQLGGGRFELGHILRKGVAGEVDVDLALAEEVQPIPQKGLDRLGGLADMEHA